MLIGEFTKATGLGRDTVRFYVKKGLLAPNVSSGGTNRYQDFGPELVDRARLIRDAQALGFTLRQISALGSEYEKGGLSRQRQIGLLQERLAAIDEQARTLQRLRRYFRSKIEWLGAGARGPAPRFPQAGADATTTSSKVTKRGSSSRSASSSASAPTSMD